MKKQQKNMNRLLLLGLMIVGVLSVMAAGCGGGGGGGGSAVDLCPGQKVCGNSCISASASCCPDGYSCSSPFTCNSNSECECPAGQQLCGSKCIPASASCCPDGSYCASPAMCDASGMCTSDGTGFVGNIYHMSANGCPGGIVYGYTGPNYTACNMYLNSAITSKCTKFVDRCR